jgi:hypothetical protein
MKHHLVAAAIVAFAATFASVPESGASAPERFWLASKFDGRRAMIYFDTLRFGNSFPATAEALYPAAGFGEATSMFCLLNRRPALAGRPGPSAVTVEANPIAGLVRPVLLGDGHAKPCAQAMTSSARSPACGGVPLKAP